MYSENQINQALKLYDQTKSVTKVIQCLGYPTRRALYNWIATRDAVPKPKATRKRWNNTPDHPMHPSVELKMDVIHRCFELGENLQLISGEIGYTRSSIYSWRKKYLQKGVSALPLWLLFLVFLQYKGAP